MKSWSLSFKKGSQYWKAVIIFYAALTTESFFSLGNSERRNLQKICPWKNCHPCFIYIVQDGIWFYCRHSDVDYWCVGSTDSEAHQGRFHSFLSLTQTQSCQWCQNFRKLWGILKYTFLGYLSSPCTSLFSVPIQFLQFWYQNGLTILFVILKSIEVTSGLTLIIMKKIARWHPPRNIWNSDLYATKGLMGVKRMKRT